jgi:hypothetical protein
MALSFLFRRNAELCTKMARSANSVEIREQWTELAKQWELKAEADDVLIGVAPPISPKLAPMQVNLPVEEQPERFGPSAPAFIATQEPLTKTDQPLVSAEAEGDTLGLDDIWNRLVADIRSRR